MERDDKLKWSAKKYITAPLSGYLTPTARKAIADLEKIGFDHDLAFSLAESWIPERLFYNIDDEGES